MDTRIGYPNEHLAGDSDEEVASPLYATAVGLLMNAVKNKPRVPTKGHQPQEKEELVFADGEEGAPVQRTARRERKSVFDKWAEKLKDFLDNAE